MAPCLAEEIRRRVKSIRSAEQEGSHHRADRRRPDADKREKVKTECISDPYPIAIRFLAGSRNFIAVGYKILDGQENPHTDTLFVWEGEGSRPAVRFGRDASVCFQKADQV